MKKKIYFILLLIFKISILYAEISNEDKRLLYRYKNNSKKYVYKKNKKQYDDFEEDQYMVIKGTQQNESSNSQYKTIKSSYKKPSNYTGVYKIGNPYTVLGQTYYPKEQPNYKEIGMASWYGEDFHNGKTANGETYNMNDYTAAHRTLPLPSMVRITNLENGLSIIVRVNDRGPFVKGRIIDVSKKVAQKLDFTSSGTAKVKVEFLQKETEKMLKAYGLK